MYRIRVEVEMSRETLEELGGSVEMIMSLRERLSARGISVNEIFGQPVKEVVPLDGDAVKRSLHGTAREITFVLYEKEGCVTYTVKELAEFRDRKHKEDFRYCAKEHKGVLWGLDDDEVVEALLMHEEILSRSEVELLGYIIELQAQGEGQGMEVWSEGALRSKYSDFVRYRAQEEQVRGYDIKNRCYDLGLEQLQGKKK